METHPRRKRNRLNDDLYCRPGAYFITICTHDREGIFWKECSVKEPQKLPLTAIGLIAEEEIQSIAAGYNGMVRVEKHVVMPNHVHILLMMESSQERNCPDIRYAVRLLKRKVSQRAGMSVWQKGFHDHIVRNDREYQEIWKYIDENPIKWELDRYYSQAEVTSTGDGR